MEGLHNRTNFPFCFLNPFLNCCNVVAIYLLQYICCNIFVAIYLEVIWCPRAIAKDTWQIWWWQWLFRCCGKNRYFMVSLTIRNNQCIDNNGIDGNFQCLEDSCKCNGDCSKPDLVRRRVWSRSVGVHCVHLEIDVFNLAISINSLILINLHFFCHNY